jgi:hypothetical protein
MQPQIPTSDYLRVEDSALVQTFYTPESGNILMDNTTSQSVFKDSLGNSALFVDNKSITTWTKETQALVQLLKDATIIIRDSLHDPQGHTALEQLGYISYALLGDTTTWPPATSTLQVLISVLTSIGTLITNSQYLNDSSETVSVFKVPSPYSTELTSVFATRAGNSAFHNGYDTLFTEVKKLNQQTSTDYDVLLRILGALFKTVPSNLKTSGLPPTNIGDAAYSLATTSGELGYFSTSDLTAAGLFSLATTGYPNYNQPYLLNILNQLDVPNSQWLSQLLSKLGDLLTTLITISGKLDTIFPDNVKTAIINTSTNTSSINSTTTMLYNVLHPNIDKPLSYLAATLDSINYKLLYIQASSSETQSVLYTKLDIPLSNISSKVDTSNSYLETIAAGAGTTTVNTSITNQTSVISNFETTLNTTLATQQSTYLAAMSAQTAAIVAAITAQTSALTASLNALLSFQPTKSTNFNTASAVELYQPIGLAELVSRGMFSMLPLTQNPTTAKRTYGFVPFMATQMLQWNSPYSTGNMIGPVMAQAFPYATPAGATASSVLYSPAPSNDPTNARYVSGASVTTVDRAPAAAVSAYQNASLKEPSMRDVVRADLIAKGTPLIPKLSKDKPTNTWFTLPSP